MAAEAYSVWLEESEHAHMLASGEVAREHTQLERDGGWSPPRVMMAEAVEQATQRAERARIPTRFLRTVKMLTDLRRASAARYVAHAGQVNVGQQQVNMTDSQSRAGGERHAR